MTGKEVSAVIKKKSNFLFNLSWYDELFSGLSPYEIGLVIIAVCEYAKTGEIQQFEDRALAVVVKAMIISMSIQAQKYRTTCENRKRQKNDKTGDSI